MNRIAAAGLTYGLLAFAAGFVFGAMRELVLIPRLGPELGHAIEFALMLLVTVAIAAALVLTRQQAMTHWQNIAVGALGTLVVIALESGLALAVFGLPLEAYLASYDITAGAIFPFGLAVMFLAPSITALAWRN